jgi:hypothetical protein
MTGGATTHEGVKAAAEGLSWALMAASLSDWLPTLVAADSKLCGSLPSDPADDDADDEWLSTFL